MYVIDDGLVSYLWKFDQYTIGLLDFIPIDISRLELIGTEDLLAKIGFAQRWKEMRLGAPKPVEKFSDIFMSVLNWFMNTIEFMHTYHEVVYFKT